MVTIRGSGFDAGTTLTVSGTAEAVTVTDEDTLTFTMPAAASGPEDIVLTRADGESYMLENAIFIP
jgi:IPT/TIG domain